MAVMFPIQRTLSIPTPSASSRHPQMTWEYFHWRTRILLTQCSLATPTWRSQHHSLCTTDHTLPPHTPHQVLKWPGSQAHSTKLLVWILWAALWSVFLPAQPSRLWTHQPSWLLCRILSSRPRLLHQRVFACHSWSQSWSPSKPWWLTCLSTPGHQ